MSNTPSQLQTILEQLQLYAYVDDIWIKRKQDSPILVDQAEQAILALFMECLPEKSTIDNENKYDNNTFNKGFNQAIDTTAQNMRALTSQLEQEQK